ncbi:MAG: hypothetical protein IKN57_01405, partial [Parasporobacterium sp.]|nr:hypothetical protein [Parasporobacterium sp.]
ETDGKAAGAGTETDGKAAGAGTETDGKAAGAGTENGADDAGTGTLNEDQTEIEKEVKAAAGQFLDALLEGDFKKASEYTAAALASEIGLQTYEKKLSKEFMAKFPGYDPEAGLSAVEVFLEDVPVEKSSAGAGRAEDDPVSKEAFSLEKTAEKMAREICRETFRDYSIDTVETDGQAAIVRGTISQIDLKDLDWLINSESMAEAILKTQLNYKESRKAGAPDAPDNEFTGGNPGGDNEKKDTAGLGVSGDSFLGIIGRGLFSGIINRDYLSDIMNKSSFLKNIKERFTAEIGGFSDTDDNMTAEYYFNALYAGTGRLGQNEVPFALALKMSGESYTVTDADIAIDLEHYERFLEDGKAVRIDYSPAETEIQSFWNGNWYGWWAIQEGTGYFKDYSGNWFDACAIIDVDEDGYGKMVLWDDQSSMDYPIAMVDILVEKNIYTGENGMLRSLGGFFWETDYEVAKDAWLADPDAYIYGDLIEIEGEYSDPDGGFSFVVYLRPWGVLWDDVKETDPDVLPYYYDSWYLKLLEEGMDMPDYMDVEEYDPFQDL